MKVRIQETELYPVWEVKRDNLDPTVDADEIFDIPESTLGLSEKPRCWRVGGQRAEFDCASTGE